LFDGWSALAGAVDPELFAGWLLGAWAFAGLAFAGLPFEAWVPWA
jgi:hypothetical protein